MRKKLRLLIALCAVFSVLSITGIIHASKATDALQQPANYLKPSESFAYPDLDTFEQPNILVKLNKHRVYICDGKSVKYIMNCSAGMIDKNTGKSTTPTGSFKIQNERGDNFYNAKLGEGANYWTSFKDHGVYLFHTVPTDKDGNYKPKEAQKLGKTNASHGCIRLSVPDAQWINQNVPEGTPVTIKN